MQNTQKRLGVIQNLGWLDRTLRVIVGTILIAVPCYLLLTGKAEAGYLLYVILFAVYPLLTGILGADQIYNLFGVKSCDTSERNQCGSFPYEIDAALGHHPIPDSDVEHSLEHSHH